MNDRFWMAPAVLTGVAALALSLAGGALGCGGARTGSSDGLLAAHERPWAHSAAAHGQLPTEERRMRLRTRLIHHLESNRQEHAVRSAEHEAILARIAELESRLPPRVCSTAGSSCRGSCFSLLQIPDRPVCDWEPVQFADTEVGRAQAAAHEARVEAWEASSVLEWGTYLAMDLLDERMEVLESVMAEGASHAETGMDQFMDHRYRVTCSGPCRVGREALAPSGQTVHALEWLTLAPGVVATLEREECTGEACVWTCEGGEEGQADLTWWLACTPLLGDIFCLGGMCLSDMFNR